MGTHGFMVLAEETIPSRRDPPLIMKFHCCKVIIIYNYIYINIIIWGFPLNGGTPKWIVLKGKPSIKMDDLGVLYPHLWKPTQKKTHGRLRDKRDRIFLGPPFEDDRGNCWSQPGLGLAVTTKA